MKNQNYPKTEHVTSDSHRHLLCWKSTLAGLLITIMGFMMLTALGGVVAGFTAEGLITNESGGGSALASGAGLWLGLSAVIALFCGSYFALRISRFVTAKVGAAHGFVIASLFFILMFVKIGSFMGGAMSNFAKVAQGAGDQASSLSSSPMVQDTFNKVIGNANLKSDPKEVAQGLTNRLLQGDVESAKNYLAYQTGMNASEVDAKIAQLKSDFEAAAKRVGEKTARGVADASLSLFVVFLAGLIGAVVGGRVGAHSNNDRPFATFSPMSNARGSMMPYVLGWFLGVPASILMLIAVLRSIF